MRWNVPEFTRAQVNKAGEVLLKARGDVPAQTYYEALEVVNNWRAIHARPLQTMKNTLHRRALGVCEEAIVSQRTKRVPAIIAKLRNNHAQALEMKLSQMHDIGGCRSVLKSVEQVRALVESYKRATAKNPTRAGLFQREYDYLSKPKDSGYRSVHLVYRYHSDAAANAIYNNLKIEIQVRTALQHYWATAVETAGFFTGQALKSNFGEADWKRFFVLVGSEFARRENLPLVPGAPANAHDARLELSRLSKQISALEAFRASTKVVVERSSASKDTSLFLLHLKLEERRIQAIPFRKQDVARAQAEYERLEANSDPERTQTVLVSVDSVAALPKAYPSFYLDIEQFVRAFRQILGTSSPGPRTLT